MSPSKFFGIPENMSAHGGQVDHMIDVVHWFMIVLFVGWTLFFLLCLFKFWHRRHPKANYHGVRNHVSTHLEIGVVIIEAVLLLGFAFPLWADRVDSWETVQKMDPARVRVVGWQFGWTFHYPGKDGRFGRVDPDLISPDNQLGIDYDDPNAADDFLDGTLKLPSARPAVLQVTSLDVIHNLHIVPMRIQQDAIPGREIPMWFTPTRPLETTVVCGQLCGEQHGNMVGRLEVIEAADYDTWFASRSDEALKKSRAPAVAAR